MESKEQTNENLYNGKDILASKKYRRYRDLLRAIINENDFYELECVDNLLDEILTKKENK